MTHLIFLLTTASLYFAHVPHKVTKHEVQKRGYHNGQQIYHLNIETELERRATKEELKELALALTKKEKNYYRIWIFHFLKGQSEEPWAITHFTPALEVSILGTTESEEKALSVATQKDHGEVIGKWRRSGNFSYVVTFFRQKGKLLCRLDFSDGSSMEEKLFHQGQKYWHENTHGEYYKMEGENLGSYNKSGKRFAILKRVSN